MPPQISTNFADILDPRFQRIFDDVYNQLPDMLPTLFSFPANNGRDTMRWSSVGAMDNWTQFTGTITYQDRFQGYDTTATPLEFASGVQVERKLFDDDQFNVMDQRPRALATSANRTRQVHGARQFNNSFSTDTFLYNNSESVALCSNSHTTTSGASTASGFDNLTTSALTATAVAAARIQMVGFRDDQAGRISLVPDELLYPPDLYENAYEIIASSGKVDTANNNRNVHEGKYRGIEWNYLTSTTDWWMMDSGQRQQMLHWVDRVPMEFAMVEDFDTLVAKWRGYMRYANAWTDWRFILGANVS